MQINSWRFLFKGDWTFTIKGRLSFLVKNCLQGIEPEQANLSARDLLEGCWENITESNLCPRTWEGGAHTYHLSVGPHGLTLRLLSQYRVHSSSSLWTNRISSLIHCHPDVACCLNTGLTESYKSYACSSIPRILIPTSWERESAGPQWDQQWPRMGLRRLRPSQQQVLQDNGSQRRAVGHGGPVGVWGAPFKVRPQLYPVVKAV